MIRSLAFALVAGLAFALTAPVFAQEKPHLYSGESIDSKMEFLAKLRRKGYIDLAKEFTEQMAKTATPEELPMLKLEEARTIVTLAKTSPPSERAQMIGEARAAFEPFVKANPNTVAGAKARVEMANLYALQGLMRLNKAYTEKKEDEREAGAKAARDLYDLADAEFAAAIKTLETAAAKKDAAVQLEFDQALNLLDKAQAYINTENSTQNRDRAMTVEKARLIFAKFAQENTALGLMANAYLVKCYQEGQSPDKIVEHLGIVQAASGPSAIPAQKQATYYDILYIKTMPNFKGDRLKATVENVDLWLKRYPFARKTVEGEHLRFEQAVSYLQLSGALTEGFKDKYKKLNAKEQAIAVGYLNSADKVALDLKKDNGDFAERGAGVHQYIIDVKIDIGVNDAIPKTSGGFDDMLVLVERKFQEAARAKEPAKSKLFNEGQQILRGALAIGEKSGATPTKLHDAQFMFGAAYYDMGDFARAAISFEALARANPPSKKSADAAAQAVQLYKKFVVEDRDESARYYLHELSNYILGPERQTIWKDHQVIGITRYQLAMDYFAEKDYKNALEQLSKLTPEFGAYTFAQADAVFIALSAREAEMSPEGKKAWTTAAREALARMGQLSPTADATTTYRWFIASMKEPEILYSEAFRLSRENKEKEAAERYQAMAKSLANLDAALKQHGGKLAKERQETLGLQIKVLSKYTHLGAADVEYRKGNYPRILDKDMLGDTVAEIARKWDGKSDIPVPDVAVVGDSISLVLRAFVQMEKIDEAKNVYRLLMHIKPASGEAHDNANFTRAIIRELANQVEEMNDKNETAKLKSMVAKFTTFGDSLAKTLVYDNKKPEPADVKNLIKFYRSLEQYKKAADLVKTVPEPRYLNEDNLKATPDQERELAIYWDFQLEGAILRRQSKDFEGANKEFNRIINHKNSRAAALAKKELIHIYEDQEKYGAATKQWGELMKELQRSGIGQNKRAQQLYFDCYYYNSLCFYKLSQKPETIKAGKSELYLKTAASMIARLESSKDQLGWQIVGGRYQEYMAKEKTLKAAYEAAKRGLKAPPPEKTAEKAANDASDFRCQPDREAFLVHWAQLRIEPQRHRDTERIGLASTASPVFSVPLCLCGKTL